MEYQAPGSNTELRFGQDLSYKRYSEPNIHQNPQYPINNNKSPSRPSEPPTAHVGLNLVDLASRFQVYPFGPKIPSSKEISQRNMNIAPFPGPNYMHDFNKMQLIPPKDDESVTFSSMQNLDENRESNRDTPVLAKYCDPKDLIPSVVEPPKPKEIRSKTPFDLHSKRASMGELTSTRDLSGSQILKDTSGLVRSFSRASSPTLKRKIPDSTERFYETMTERIMQKSPERSKSGALKKMSESLGSSPVKTNKSKATYTQLYSDTKKNAKMKSLGGLKLVGSPQFEKKSQTGINMVRNILDDALDEKGDLKARIEELRRLMGEERATLEKTEENIKVLSNHMGCLAKRSDNYFRNTVTGMHFVHKTKEEVQDLQGEVNFLTGRLKRMAKKMELESELIQLNHQRIKSLRESLAEESKNRDKTDEICTKSRNEKNKLLEKHYEASKFKQTILETLEDNFKRYAVEK